MKKSVILALLFASSTAVQLDAPETPVVNAQVKADTAVEVLADHTDPMDSYIDEDEEDVQIDDFTPADFEEVEIDGEPDVMESHADMLADKEEEDDLLELEKGKKALLKKVEHKLVKKGKKVPTKKSQVTKKEKKMAQDIQADDEEFDDGEVDDDLVALEDEDEEDKDKKTSKKVKKDVKKVLKKLVKKGTNVPTKKSQVTKKEKKMAQDIQADDEEFDSGEVDDDLVDLDEDVAADEDSDFDGDEDVQIEEEELFTPENEEDVDVAEEYFNGDESNVLIDNEDQDEDESVAASGEEEE